MVSSFPILPNESFTSNHTEKRGVELDFRVPNMIRPVNNSLFGIPYLGL